MFISGVNDTGEKREKFWDKIFLNILLRAYFLVHFTPKDWSFAYFSFLGEGKLILAGLSNCRCQWHRQKILGFMVFFWTVSTTPGKYKLFTGVVDTGDKFFAGVVDTAEQFITGVNDTGDKHSFANISANFRKNSKKLQRNTWGPGGHWFMKKLEVKNLVSDSF